MNRWLLSILFACTFASSTRLAAQEIAADASSDEPVAESASTAEPREPTLHDYFRASAVNYVRISPDGTRLAYTDQQQTIYVGSPSEGFKPLVSFDSRRGVSQLEWVGPSGLMAKLVSSQLVTRFIAFNVAIEDGELTAKDVIAHQTPGLILDALPNEPEHVLFWKSDVKDGNAFASVYRLEPFKESRTQLGEGDRLNKRFDQASWFVLDRDKKLLLGLDTWGEQIRLFQRSAGGTKWSRIWSGNADDQFIPIQLSRDENTLFVLTNTTTDRLVAAEFDVAAGQVSRILYEDPVTDVHNLLMSERTGRPAAVVVNRDGLFDYVFFDAELEQRLETLQEQFADASVTVTELAANDSSAVVYVSSDSDAGTYHFCLLASAQCAEIGKARPNLTGHGLAPTETIEVPSSDGFSVFAYLTMPISDTDDASIPLIVMPHGGPIGVNDDRRYNADVQWLARNGYAVLRVNYRGSSGYGKTFLSAGMRQWGRGIEDDIEAATDAALAGHERLSGDRVCIYGASYGGYSALQSLVRSPERYRCAASFAGVTDLPLLFSRSVYRRDEALRDQLIKMVGDPNLDVAELREYSPVYNYRKITKPVFLAHGTDDSRVDIEHSWRLQRLLKMTGADVEMHDYADVGHGFRTVGQIEKFYTPLLAFFDRHLDVVRPATQPPLANTEPDG
ncbi:MAG: prolyl oligopeptidase family serine peptidase [Pseudomonadota bacterium]